MRSLNRNKQPIYYATFVSKEEAKDDYGNGTGTWIITYSTPQKVMWNVGFVESDAEVEMFGISAMSTLRIVAPKKGFPLNETSILWFGKEPPSPYNPTNPKHNYVVAGMRPSLNEMVFYARKVEMN